MKLTVIKHLNVRVGAPSVNAPCYQYISPGSELEVDENLYPGDYYDGNNQWYKDSAGNYYWSGGVYPADENIFLKSAPTLVNYNQIINVPDTWRNSKGANVKIAILDSGIFAQHPDFGDAFTAQTLYDVSMSSKGYNDSTGHGTHCAGLIGARSVNTEGIIGIAPKSELYIIKVDHEDFGPTEDRITRGIELAIRLNVDIINMSFEIGDFNDIPLVNAINQAAEKGIIMIASAGENDDLSNNHTAFLYPAMYRQCIGIGVIDSGFIDQQFNPNLKYLLPYAFFWSSDIASNKYYSQRKGSSMASAILSGVCALILSGSGTRLPKNPSLVKYITNQLTGNFPDLANIKYDITNILTIVKT